MTASLPDPATFLSGEPLALEGRRARLRAQAADRMLDARLALSRAGARLDELAAAAPTRDVLVVSVYRPPAATLVGSLPDVALGAWAWRCGGCSGRPGEVVAELAEFTVASHMTDGKFPNANELIAAAGEPPPDWVILVDDDVTLPTRFLDRFIGVCERFGLALAQPAQTRLSHAAWPVTRRRGGALLRETRFVEAGPVTAFRRDAAAELIPFPSSRWSWGLDVHWAAVAQQRGWTVGIVDALPVRHEEGVIAATYSSEAAIAEAQQFLADRPYVTSDLLQETLVVHRRA